jgi:alkyldihydroxyacetonephosphate synthase
MTDLTEERWAGWGDPGRAVTLPDPVRDLLASALGVTRVPPPVDPTTIELPAPRLTYEALEGLRGAVGESRLHLDPATRLRHSAGKSTLELVRQRAGAIVDAPDAVICPGSHDEVLAVLRVCAANRIAVVPFGGGTSVVGGLTVRGHAFSAVIVIDLYRLDQLLCVDAVSHLATLQSGLRAPVADALLAEHGFTLGHLPQSYERASIGGFAATRSSGQASAGYGRFDDMVVGLTVATPQGTIELGHAPASSTGPDLRELFLGSEGALGVITSVTVRVRPLPVRQRYEGWRFDSFAEGVAAMRTVVHSGHRPSVLRLSDEIETALGLGQSRQSGGPGDGGCLLIVGYDDDGSLSECLTAAAGTALGSAPGEHWAAGRFAAPYLRDALLDEGAFAETLETATFWSDLLELYQRVRAAIVTAIDEPVLVLCHVSHVYETGASLYFTVVCAQGDDPSRRWAAIKTAANEAIIAAGAAISHHHGIGAYHRDAYARQAGPLAIALLRAVKAAVDPAGILNPGILIEESHPS